MNSFHVLVEALEASKEQSRNDNDDIIRVPEQNLTFRITTQKVQSTTTIKRIYDLPTESFRLVWIYTVQ
eukprot:CAMPEP_0116833998 /NCGR_PEP_ID=MMETSP0418-20121206/6751_1 /TAXON_ID=1158023 /ORGANISM="Astrosyne radiata, Strain 13vi08-1A" /LENGTH=68 /DNA_ID=CAMNT_0004463517 /DNA_START=91 /DNA_END=294 /DNA_ORIENTATION=+